MRPLVALVLLALAGGCAASAPRPAKWVVAKAPVFVAEVADPRGRLTPAEEARLRGSVALDLIWAGRAGKTFDVVARESEAEVILRIRVDELAEARPWLALILGFGAGRPGFAAGVAFERGGSGEVLAHARFERVSTAFAKPVKGTKQERDVRAAMLDALADEIERFVRRHR